MGVSRVEETWSELGFRIRPLGLKVFVRTDPPPQREGLLWLPPDYHALYGRSLGTKVDVTGVVLGTGTLVPLPIPEGSRVVFKRMEFGWTHRLADTTYVGWLEWHQIIGFVGG